MLPVIKDYNKAATATANYIVHSKYMVSWLSTLIVGFYVAIGGYLVVIGKIEMNMFIVTVSVFNMIGALLSHPGRWQDVTFAYAMVALIDCSDRAGVTFTGLYSELLKIMSCYASLRNLVSAINLQIDVFRHCD